MFDTLTWVTVFSSFLTTSIIVACGEATVQTGHFIFALGTLVRWINHYTLASLNTTRTLFAIFANVALVADALRGAIFGTVFVLLIARVLAIGRTTFKVFILARTLRWWTFLVFDAFRLGSFKLHIAL